MVSKKNISKGPKILANLPMSRYFSEEGIQSVSAYLGRVETGQPKVYDTPFARGETTAELLSSWMAELEAVSKSWPSLWKYEVDQSTKVGPLSVMKPLKDRMTDIRSYYWDILLSQRPIDDRAVAATINDWKYAKGIRLRNEMNTLNKMKLSTNSGSPYFTKRRLAIADSIPCEIEFNRYGIVQKLPRGAYDACAVIGWRGQEGGSTEEDVKQRVVWMFPFAVNVKELQVYQPLIESAQRLNVVPAWVSMDAVDRSITQLFASKGRKDPIICTDFSKFDQHFNSTMQDAAETILRGILSREEKTSTWLKTIFPIKYNIPMVIQPGIFTRGAHGMGSGSGGTNADETLAHRALQHEAAILRSTQLNPNSQCLGDDGIITYPGITVEDIIDTYSSHGQEMNEDKQYVSTQDCIYLRRWHHERYRVDGICAGVYPTTRALGRLRYLERYMNPEIWSKEMVNLRYLSILENVKFHPMRDEFVEFCMKRDKFRLGLDIPGFFDSLPKLVKEATDFMPDFLGYTRTLQSEGKPDAGINDWWVVKYLKSR